MTLLQQLHLQPCACRVHHLFKLPAMMIACTQVWHVPCGGVTYGDDNLVFIANDWHTALLPVYLQVMN
jgi:hypothetical protein